VREDYLRYVHGRPRLDGVREFLASRGLTAPEGEPGDGPDAPTVHGLGRAKELLFMEQVERHGVAAFPAAGALLHELRNRGARTGGVAASLHGRRVVPAAGVLHLFDTLGAGGDAAP